MLCRLRCLAWKGSKHMLRVMQGKRARIIFTQRSQSASRVYLQGSHILPMGTSCLSVPACIESMRIFLNMDSCYTTMQTMRRAEQL